MSDSMKTTDSVRSTDSWMSVAEAAAYLKVHPRTIERRIASSKLQTRRAVDGQLQVCLNLPEAPPPAEPTGPDPFQLVTEQLSVVTEQAENQVHLAVSASTAMVRQSQHETMIARQDADRAWIETTLARRSARWAWSIVGAAAMIALVALTWAAHSTTKSSMELSHLEAKVETLAGDLDRSAFDKEVLRKQLAEAKENQARVEGQASVLVEQQNRLIAIGLPRPAEIASGKSPDGSPNKGPTTRPTLPGILMRLAGMSEMLVK
jgi:hypothetical protein